MTLGSVQDRSQQTSSHSRMSDTLVESDLQGNVPFTKVFYEEPNHTQDTLNLARSLFDLREYRKCAHLLTPLTQSSNLLQQDGGSAKSLIQNCLFMKNYALFLVSEQQKEEEILETGGSSDKVNCSTVVNKQLGKIEQELEELYRTKNLNALNCYLLGVIYKERNKKQEAKEAFIRALNQMPLLWSAWLELGSLLAQTDRQVLEQLRDHWMLNFYFASFFLDIQ